MRAAARASCWLAVVAAAAMSLSFAHAELKPSELRSGYADLGRETKAMQDDDTANPGMLSVLEGDGLWKAKAGATNKSCADCHGAALASMKGVSARYPAFNEKLNRSINLDQRINLCRTEQQQAQPFAYESKPMLALSAFIGRQSRGEALNPPADPRMQRFIDAGKARFNERQGQLNLSCAQCHDDNWSKQLAGNVIPQGHPNGYPLYRLEWQSIGSLQRRLRNCLIGMRAETYDYGSPEYVELESYLAVRAKGLRVETPAVRP